MKDANLDGTVLLVTANADAAELSATLSAKANVIIEHVASRRAAIASLRRRSYLAVLLDADLSAEVATSGELWSIAGPALPLELSLSGWKPDTVSRLLRHALDQLAHAKDAAREMAKSAVEEKLRSALTAVLLQSDLLLQQNSLPAGLLQEIRHMQKATQAFQMQLT